MMFAASTLAAGVGIMAISVYKIVQSKRRQKHTDVYESEKLVSEYLAFHYGREEEVLRWSFGPKESLDFPRRCAQICIQQFTKGSGVPLRALDIGCSVGRSTFELAVVFEKVVGVDYSQAFVDVCQQLRQNGKRQYSVRDEGDLETSLTAFVSSKIDRTRTSFQKADACDLPRSLGKFNCVLAANIICRLSKPFDFLDRLPGLVNSGGILVIASPYTWLEQFTEKSTWLGGYIGEDGKPVTGFQTLKEKFLPHFDLVKQTDEPYFIRETARENQWAVSHVTVWRRH